MYNEQAFILNTCTESMQMIKKSQNIYIGQVDFYYN